MVKPTNATLNGILTSRQFSIADLITITTVGGSTLRYCSGQQDITSTAGAFSAGGTSGPYFDRKDNKAKVVWKLGVGTDTLVIDVLPGTATVEGHTWWDAVRLGIFDGADFELDRAYMATYGTVAAGCAPLLFKGRIAEINADRAIITLSVNDYRELLNQQSPRWLFAASCQNTLYDASCTVVSTNFSADGTVSAGSSNTFIVASTLAQANGYFDNGRITFTSGQLNGLGFAISSWALAGTVMTFVQPLPFTPTSTDTFRAFAGCDLSTGAGGCAKFSNLPNFRGMPYIPDPGQAL